MIGPTILNLDAAVAMVASESNHAAASTSAEQAPSLNHTHVFAITQSSSGAFVTGHVSHASHSSHASHVSSSNPPPYYPPAVYAPSAPTDVTAKAGNGAVEVSWDSVSNSDGGSVTYVVRISPGNLTKTVIDVTSVTFSGLTNGTTYTFTVTATNSAGTSPVSTPSDSATPSLPVLAHRRPVISGQAAAGHRLTAITDGWTKGTKFKFQWYSAGKAIPGATYRSWVPQKGSLGEKITVHVTGAKSHYKAPLAQVSLATHRVALATTPKISGKARVGKSLQVKPGKWTSGTHLTYAWYADGVRIRNQSGSTFELTREELGAKISVRVTGSKVGYGKVVLKSAPTKTVSG